VDTDFEIKAYYAGHVLGAAMFHIRVGQQTLVYTGDFNTTADRHLGSAHIDRCRPDVLITESTYGSTVRDSRRARERDFMAKVVDCVRRGGKVLVPVFAVGRAQELCILLETYLERMNLNVPIYFASGLSEKVNTYYSLFVSWTNEKIQSTFHQKNIFDFKHIKVCYSFFNLYLKIDLFLAMGSIICRTTWCNDCLCFTGNASCWLFTSFI